MYSSNIDFFITIYFIAATIANVLMFVIQAIKLYQGKDSTGLSFITFFGFNLIQLSTILYGAIQNDALLMYGYIAAFVACGAVTTMIPLYRRKHYHDTKTQKTQDS